MDKLLSSLQPADAQLEEEDYEDDDEDEEDWEMADAFDAFHDLPAANAGLVISLEEGWPLSSYSQSSYSWQAQIESTHSICSQALASADDEQCKSILQHHQAFVHHGKQSPIYPVSPIPGFEQC